MDFSAVPWISRLHGNTCSVFFLSTFSEHLVCARHWEYAGGERQIEAGNNLALQAGCSLVGDSDKSEVIISYFFDLSAKEEIIKPWGTWHNR